MIAMTRNVSHRPDRARQGVVLVVPPVVRHRWRGPLLAGLFFGLSYALVQRLLDLELPQLIQLGHSFDVREVPGTSLDSLRLRLGGEAAPIRGDLELLELELQQERAERERAQQEQEAAAQRQLEQQDEAEATLELQPPLDGDLPAEPRAPEPELPQPPSP
jgi:hypothetical protein